MTALHCASTATSPGGSAGPCPSATPTSSTSSPPNAPNSTDPGDGEAQSARRPFTDRASLGCSPALGFVHSGHELSFVLDIADLYKTEIGIPLAFDIAAEDEADIGPRTRRALRDRINETSLLDRCVNDIKRLLLPEATSTEAMNGDHDVVTLYSDGGHTVPSGRNYGGGTDQNDAYSDSDISW